MVKITIIIDSNNITVDQSSTPTKTDNNKNFFIITRNNKYDEGSRVEFVTDDYSTAVNKLNNLITNKTDLSYTYAFCIQDENGVIQRVSNDCIINNNSI